jgi:ATP-binding cassette subfamily B protein
VPRDTPAPPASVAAAAPAGLRDAFSLCRSAGGRTFWLVAGFQVLSGAVVGAQLLLAKHLVDAVTSEGSARDLTTLAPVLAALALVTVAGSIAALQAVARRELLTELVDHEATLRVIDAVSRLELVRFEDPDVFDLIERSRAHSNLRALQVVNATGAIVTSTVTATAVIVTLGILAPWVLTLVLAAVVPLLYVGSRNNWAYYHFVRAATRIERQREYFARLLTQRDHAAEIRALELAEQLRSSYRSAEQAIVSELERVLAANLRRSMLGVAINGGAIVLALGVAVALYSSGRLDLASASVAILAIVQLRSTLENLALQTAQIHEASLFLGDLRRLGSAAERHARATAPPAAPLRTLTVDGAGFSYPRGAKPALIGVSFSVTAGEMIAVVGENGSGKSTLAKLLAGLYEPTEGRLLWNGTPHRPAPAEVSVLLQEHGRYWLTLRRNLLLGLRDEPAAGAFEAAVTDAGVRAIIDDTPRGLETLLSAELGGQDLSAGQWQRIALARCLLRAGPVMVLDEPTSATDHAGERRFIEWAHRRRRDACLIVVTHRPAVARAADRVLMLADGRLVNEGRHDELVARGGHYAQLMRDRLDEPRVMIPS